eukprot:TRINITY_DN4634_c0_g1_i2.p1 TRINITY_DN4634_c0_g1~~TRINITY_DN4634_c0_g1_i2.p1  ORF type:complete len:276 (+),score=94.52 TRINITY_DN4634_c0_g1_i2:3-830(+)
MVHVEEVEEEQNISETSTTQPPTPAPPTSSSSTDTTSSPTPEETKEDVPSPPQRTDEQLKEIEDKFQQAQNIKNEGNKLFSEAQFDPAVIKYTECIDLMSGCEDVHASQCAVYYGNRAACYMSMAQAYSTSSPSPANPSETSTIKAKDEEKAREFLELVVKDCTKALSLNKTYTKALLRRASAQETLRSFGNLSRALDDYTALLKLEPGNDLARRKVAYLPAQVKEQQEKDKDEMIGKLKSLGNSILGKFGLSTNNFQFTQDPATGGYSMNFKQS